MDRQGDRMVTIRMNIVERIQLEIAMQLLITEIRVLVRQINEKSDQLILMREK